MLGRLYQEARCLNSECLKALSAELSECSPELQRWALASVITRNFALKGADGKVSALGLLPFIDLFNHKVCSQSGKISWTCSFQERHECVVMVADRSIAKGEQLTFVYTAAPDAALLVQYGIPPSDNSNLHNMAGIPIHSNVLGTASQASYESNALINSRRDIARSWGWNDLTKPLLFTIPEAWLILGRQPFRS